MTQLQTMPFAGDAISTERAGDWTPQKATRMSRHPMRASRQTYSRRQLELLLNLRLAALDCPQPSLPVTPTVREPATQNSPAPTARKGPCHATHSPEERLSHCPG